MNRQTESLTQPRNPATGPRITGPQLSALRTAWREPSWAVAQRLADSPAFVDARAAAQNSEPRTDASHLGAAQSVLVAHLQPPPPRPSLRGTAGRGLAYQRKIAPVLRTLAASIGWLCHVDPWFAPLDNDDAAPTLSGWSGWWSPDFILEAPSGSVLVLEAKLTYTPAATAQLLRYIRNLEQLGIPAEGVQVCRHLTVDAPPAAAHLEDVNWALPLHERIWHLWL